MRVQASGKFILAGEHFILYQCPALALPWHSATLQLIPQQEDPQPELPMLLEAWTKARQMLGLSPPGGFPFMLRSAIPLGCGFGSSAALCVALLRAASAEAQTTLSKETLIHHATTLEALFHGRSSGLDPAVVVRETPLRFQMGQAPQPWRWSLEGVGIVLAVSREQRQTAVAVGRVRTFAEQHPARFEALLVQARSLVEQVQSLCERSSSPHATEDGKQLGAALDHNHALLAEVGVSSPHLEQLVQCARQNGALGAKLTGAGLGGGMFAIAPTKELPLLAKALQEQGARSTHIYDPHQASAPQETL